MMKAPGHTPGPADWLCSRRAETGQWAGGLPFACAQVRWMRFNSVNPLPRDLAPDTQNRQEPIGGVPPLNISYGKNEAEKDTQNMRVLKT